MAANKIIPILAPPQETHTRQELHAARALLDLSGTGQPSLRNKKRAANRRLKRAIHSLTSTRLDSEPRSKKAKTNPSAAITTSTFPPVSPTSKKTPSNHEAQRANQEASFQLEPQPDKDAVKSEHAKQRVEEDHQRLWTGEDEARSWQEKIPFRTC